MIHARIRRALAVAGLSLLLFALLTICVFTMSISFNLVKVPLSEQWLVILTNVGYSIFAGSLLIFMVAIFNQLRAIVKPGS